MPKDSERPLRGDEEERVASFIASMPLDYRTSFDFEAARAHEAIVQRRAHHATHVEIWRELSERVVAICVVADDKPGLLSCISAALVTNNIDVVSAHAYCRTRDGLVEAIDLLWIKHLPNEKGLTSPIRAKDVIALADAIKRAIADNVTALQATERTSSPPSSSDGRQNGVASIRFGKDKHGQTVLTVEAVDRPGLLLAVTQALFRAGLQIVALRATTEQGSAVDRFTLAEVDGSALEQPRLLALQTAILGALDEGTLAPSRRRSAG